MAATHPPRPTAAPAPAKRRRAPERIPRHRQHLRRRGPRRAARSCPRRRRISCVRTLRRSYARSTARARKMPLSGLNPSILIAFVVRDEAEWIDLRRRIGELPRTIFVIQDEPLT
ncbi:hypothetical protein C8R44DRAFT_396668 [Mycena epipterygia]|nr:hypothetical protein C8R44DRAFT_396668 [Mycena epipterygia]